MSGKHELPQLPRRVDTLDRIAPALRSAYMPAPGGGFQMTPAAAAETDRFEAECAAIDAEHAQALARLDAEDARIASKLVRLEVARAVREAGVPGELQDAAMALIQREPLAVEWGHEAPAVFVEASHGRVGIDDAVRGWLETDAAAPYRPKPKGPAGPGPLTAAVRRLRDRVH